MNEGRMLRKRISRSRKFASLSKDAKILFCMLIPHYDPHGKMNGSPHFIKGEVVPYIDELTVPVIKKCLVEISQKTSVKWFQQDGLWWLHSTNDQEHQKFNKVKVRKDLLPSWSNSRPTPDLLQSNARVTPEFGTHKVEEEEEKEVEEEKEEEEESSNPGECAAKRQNQKTARAPEKQNGSVKPQPHLFRESPYFDPFVLTEKLSDWPEERVMHYHEDMLSASEAKGLKYLDWSAVAVQWYLRDIKRARRPP